MTYSLVIISPDSPASMDPNVRRQCMNTVKIDELYLNNQPLADDRMIQCERYQAEIFRHSTPTATVTSSQESPARGDKSYATTNNVLADCNKSAVRSSANRQQEFKRATTAKHDFEIKEPDNRGCYDWMPKLSSQPQKLQQASKTLGNKAAFVSSGEVSKLSQHGITTSSHHDIKDITSEDITLDTSSTPQSNVTCGSCGQKGHNHKWEYCPNYYTEEEFARREVHAEQRRQKVEERHKEEEVTINLLSEQQKAIEDMTSQIQQQMPTLEQRLHRRTSELDSQLASKLEKMQATYKKRKK